MRTVFKPYIALVIVLIGTTCAWATTLKVKPGRSAIVKSAPTGSAEELLRLPSGTKVLMISQVPRYYSIRLPDGNVGWSYKGSFEIVDEPAPSGGTGATPATKANLLARPDVLKIVIVDVEVGDATLIICPEEDGERDVILIDTGEDDSGRIRKELQDNGFSLLDRPITRFMITHYDSDHCGDALELIPLSQIVYDHGNNNIKSWYLTGASVPGVDRRTMTLDYQEVFSGGVTIECVAVNQATDLAPNIAPSSPNDNPNSIAVIISYDGFDYFTGGDLTHKAEKSLATGIKNCDAYHVNHHGSSSTSSDLAFVTKLDPEVSIASNGTKFGHPRATIAQRLIGIGSEFYQTNINTDSKAHQPDAKYVADDTYPDDNEDEELEGAKGTIRVVVDSIADKYYVIMPGLPLSEATFDVEDN